MRIFSPIFLITLIVKIMAVKSGRFLGRPLNSNGAPPKKRQKKVATFFLVFLIGLLPPWSFCTPKFFSPPPNVYLAPLIAILAPLIAILAPPEAFCTTKFFSVDQTLSWGIYSRFFGINVVNSGKMRPLEAAPVR